MVTAPGVQNSLLGPTSFQFIIKAFGEERKLEILSAYKCLHLYIVSISFDHFLTNRFTLLLKPMPKCLLSMRMR